MNVSAIALPSEKGVECSDADRRLARGAGALVPRGAFVGRNPACFGRPRQGSSLEERSLEPGLAKQKSP